MSKNIIIIGGGAAGFFAAINCAEKNRDYTITILEKSSTVLSKVKISGGGRCNVTHGCFDVKELVKFYPRGEKQLLGPFTKFNPSSTINWFEKRGVEIKKEEDGRMFPVSDSSQTIINCFLGEAARLGIKVNLQCGVQSLQRLENAFRIETTTHQTLSADAVIVTTGSSHSVWNMLGALGHTIVTPVPSLFTFNINDERIKGLEGLAVDTAKVSLPFGTKLNARGPVLITHWGMSGPAILRLSALGARALHALDYKFEVEINWVNKDTAELKEIIQLFKKNNPKKNILTNPLFGVPKRLWERLVFYKLQKTALNFADLSNALIASIAVELTASRFPVSGKSTYKDEFVTSGGVNLSEVDFRTMQSKIIPGLFFAGEVLDIDAVTGGFNFQAAWTTAYIAAQSV